MAAQSLKPGRIMHLDEVCRQGAATQGMSVRIMGRLESYNVETGHCQIAYKGEKLTVDVSHILGAALRPGSLYQFIGEMGREPAMGAKEQEQFILRARIVRNVDGLDEDLYEQAVMLRRKFESGKHAEIMR